MKKHNLVTFFTSRYPIIVRHRHLEILFSKREEIINHSLTGLIIPNWSRMSRVFFWSNT